MDLAVLLMGLRRPPRVATNQPTSTLRLRLVGWPVASEVGWLKELCALDFGAFGSLYLNTAEKPTGSLPIDEEYCIGPHCG